MKDVIKNKSGIDVFIKHKNIEEDSRIFCDRIVYMHDHEIFMGKPVFDHHLMFYSGKELVFKVWLRQDRRYKDIFKVMEDIGMIFVPNILENCRNSNERKAFIGHLDRIIRTERFYPLNIKKTERKGTRRK